MITMSDEYTCSGWACTDCTILLANGEAPADMSEDQVTAREDQIDARNAGYTITLGMLREEHSCDGTSDECDCEVTSFSWSPCDVCGSNLGGERHAVSFWKITGPA